VEDEHAARINLGPADSRRNRTSQGKPSLPRRPYGAFFFTGFGFLSLGGKTPDIWPASEINRQLCAVGNGADSQFEK
jgi:hypothetical protein